MNTSETVRFLKVGGVLLQDVPVSDAEKLQRMLNVPPVSSSFQSVSAYLADHPETRTEYRTSKSGTELVKIFYPSGVIKEYPVDQLSTTTAFIDC